MGLLSVSTSPLVEWLHGKLPGFCLVFACFFVGLARDVCGLIEGGFVIEAPLMVEICCI